jgi:hypothetical protein
MMALILKICDRMSVIILLILDFKTGLLLCPETIVISILNPRAPLDLWTFETETTERENLM